MSKVKEYKDILAFHPGYYLEDIIEDMQISQAEFATRMGTTTKTLSKLINGKANISNDLAKKLSLMMGTSVEVWQNLQNTYDKKLIEIAEEKDFDEQEEIVKQIDYEYFVKIGDLPVTREQRSKIANLCRYFKVADLRIMSEPDFLVNYRTGVSTYTQKNLINSKAWVQTALNVSADIKTKPYDAKKLKAALPEIRSMTISEPEVFMPRMTKIFADCGVAFVLLPPLKNAGINGAVKWVSDDRVVLAMNNRGIDADKFWFSLFHEIKHVLQQKIKFVFVSESAEDLKNTDSILEKEADKFASDYLIPQAELKKFAASKYTSDKDIVAFANSLGIHPGIVAGRLQHEGTIPQNRCSKLKEKYHIEISNGI